MCSHLQICVLLVGLANPQVRFARRLYFGGGGGGRSREERVCAHTPRARPPELRRSSFLPLDRHRFQDGRLYFGVLSLLTPFTSALSPTDSFTSFAFSALARSPTAYISFRFPQPSPPLSHFFRSLFPPPTSISYFLFASFPFPAAFTTATIYCILPSRLTSPRAHCNTAIRAVYEIVGQNEILGQNEECLLPSSEVGFVDW